MGLEPNHEGFTKTVVVWKARDIQINQETRMSEAVEQKWSNPHLQGNNAPVYEEITADDLEVIGEIPKDLNGNFLRTDLIPTTSPMRIDTTSLMATACCMVSTSETAKRPTAINLWIHRGFVKSAKKASGFILV